MDEPLQYNSTSFLNDPTTRLGSFRRSKYGDWNEYQRVAKFNPVEIKMPPRDTAELSESDDDDDDEEETFKYKPTPQREFYLRRLASLKTSLYNPALPTFRRMDRDDAMCKLTDTHSRHNSSLPLRAFKNNQSLLNIAKDRQYKTTDSTTSSEDEQLYSIPVVNMNHNRVLNRCHSVCVFRPPPSQQSSWTNRDDYINNKQRLEKFELIKSDYLTYKRKTRHSLIV